MSDDNRRPINSEKEGLSKICVRRIDGFIVGIVIGGLFMLVYFLGASPSTFYAVSKVTLLLILIGCGIFGAIFGDKAVGKMAEWLIWFG